MRIAILMPFLLVTGLAPETDGETVPFQRVEDFSSFKDGSFPEGWKSRGGEGSAVYVV
ncbi:MAG: hypothetical protein JRJ70_15405, partial [Deltaproteobacteria bacterium]|nr:hypothetical protein [Deltaproteobacteria bacterium]